jgi:hypothetical protein
MRFLLAESKRLLQRSAECREKSRLLLLDGAALRANLTRSKSALAETLARVGDKHQDAK